MTWKLDVKQALFLGALDHSFLNKPAFDAAASATSAMLEQASLLFSQVNSLFEDREKQLEEVRSRKHLGC